MSNQVPGNSLWKIICFSHASRIKGQYTSGDMLGLAIVSSCDMPVFTKKFCNFVPATCYMYLKFSWFEFLKQGQIGLNFQCRILKVCTARSYKLWPLQHYNEPISALCPPACLQSFKHVAYTQRGWSLVHFCKNVKM